MPSILNRIGRRLKSEVPDGEAQEFLTATKIMLGLSKYKDQVKELLMQCVLEMEDSVVLQELKRRAMAAGKIDGEREFLLGIGTEKLASRTKPCFGN